MRPSNYSTIATLIFCLISSHAYCQPLMSLGKLEKYLKKKLKRNSFSLRLNEKPIGNRGVKFLSNYDFIKSIQTLTIFNGQVGDEGVKALANSTYLKNLKNLSLERNQITDKGLSYLANSESLKNLKSLNLYRNKIRSVGF